ATLFQIASRSIIKVNPLRFGAFLRNAIIARVQGDQIIEIGTCGQRRHLRPWFDIPLGKQLVQCADTYSERFDVLHSLNRCRTGKESFAEHSPTLDNCLSCRVTKLSRRAAAWIIAKDAV